MPPMSQTTARPWPQGCCATRLSTELSAGVAGFFRVSAASRSAGPAFDCW